MSPAASPAATPGGAPPPLAPCLYRCVVTHRRPAVPGAPPAAGHRFAYRLTSLLLDLDGLPELDRRARLLSVDRPNLLGFSPRDHGPCDGSPLQPWVLGRLDAAGLPRPERPRVLLLCLPRLLGHVFDPISVYWVFDGGSGALAGVLGEVRNTFGGRHTYVLDPAAALGTGPAPEVPKALAVSPFLERRLAYRFRLPPPGERLALRIEAVDTAAAGGAVRMVACQVGSRLPLTDGALLRGLRDRAPAPFGVTAAIHAQALRLWLKGAPVVGLPGAPPAPAAGRPG